MITAGVLGASGYMGGEALRVLLQHPQVQLAWATSRRDEKVADVHPNLLPCDLRFTHPDDITPCDVVFMALPTDESMRMAPRLLQMGCKVIDLGAVFRLRDRDDWQRVYGREHESWSLMQQAVYGVNELYGERIAATTLVANPGCFASAAILAFAPLVADALVQADQLSVTGISGTAGAGAALSRAAHHAEIGNNLVAYNVVDHRHSYEMEQALGDVAGGDVAGAEVSVHFTPVYAPITRGILAVCSARLLQPLSRAELLKRFKDFYCEHPFIRILESDKEVGVSWQYKPYPWVSAVAGSNYCFIGLDVDERRQRVVVFSALDSLGKGGALVGVENMNLMFGLERTLGLTHYGRHPA